MNNSNDLYAKEFDTDPDVNGNSDFINNSNNNNNNNNNSSIVEDGAEVEKHLYKVLLIGDYAVGKTSLIKRYCTGIFSPNYKLTIGVDFSVKDIEWEKNKVVSLQLWDIAGHERFGTMTRVYYRYAIAAIIVFDLSRPSTFDAVTKWREDVNSKVVLANQEPIPVLLLANKSDLPTSYVDSEMLDNFCKENNFIGWYATSALNNANIDEAMRFLTKKILEVAKTNHPVKEEDGLSLNKPITNDQDTNKKSCCK
ncbi:Rab GTPase [Dictyostelium purpureum]|uniref:Ras-related protein Rab n=1 Tax=Dictyostelium purpureum TaxID=5786 RepID=F0ZAL5_DICPU|nr:Rab GTPase [Dictyostelium purpureum]EGC39020.1 Rab GTPase [Dictyostelium purpureum]|eukprot:XP_003284473.1 Rab GTPase [Dictyostelium purpureum]